MSLRIPRAGIASLILAAGATALSAQTSSSSSSSASARERDTSRSSSTTSRTSILAKGPLPDPALLDGSALEAEKRPDHGMLGEFELPGDDNPTSDKVGATGDQQPGGGGGAPDKNQKDQKQNPQMSGGGGGAPDPNSQVSAQQGGGGGSPGSESAQAGGAAGNTPAGSQAASGSEGAAGAAGANGSNSQAEGMRVGQLEGSAQAGGSSAAAAASSKPQQIALGDKAMQISPQASAPGVVGASQQPVGKDVPQQYDARTPGGGNQSGNARGNQGVEKGRVMPSGI